MKDKEQSEKYWNTDTAERGRRAEAGNTFLHHIFLLLTAFLPPEDMSEGRDGEEDVLGDCWITSWEQQTVQELEGEADHQEHLQGEADAAAEKLWSLFQAAAQCVAVMYKGDYCLFLLVFHSSGCFGGLGFQVFLSHPLSLSLSLSRFSDWNCLFFIFVCLFFVYFFYFIFKFKFKVRLCFVFPWL